MDNKPINLQKEIPDVLTAMGHVHTLLDAYDFDPSLGHMIMLRASQINQCAYCVKMHSKDAREAGESNERLDRLIVWRHVNDFSDREKAAFAWTEALTLPKQDNELGKLRATFRDYYSDQQIGLITATIAMINLWNRIQITVH